MTSQPRPPLWLTGHILRVVGILLIAFAGLCTCGLALVAGDSWHQARPGVWIQPLVAFPAGLGLWWVGTRLLREPPEVEGGGSNG